MKPRIFLAGGLIASLLFATPAAHALSNRFSGDATIELYERLVHGDPYALRTWIVQMHIQLDDVSADGRSVAVGTAIVHRDGADTTIRLEGWMSPPEGSGGKAWVEGVGDDDNMYCFVISDAADAPTPRPDSTIAAFEPADTRVQAEAGRAVANPGAVPLPESLCADLYYQEKFVSSGDFSFSPQL